MAKKAKMNKKRKEMNHVHPFYLNMTHTGRLITKCNSNSPTPSTQSCYGQYMKKKVREFVENRSDVGVKRMPNNSSSLYTANKTSQAIADQQCCAAAVQSACSTRPWQPHTQTTTPTRRPRRCKLRTPPRRSRPASRRPPA